MTRTHREILKEVITKTVEVSPRKIPQEFFIAISEMDIIEHEINNGIVLAFDRYVDDIFVVLKN